MADFHKAVWGTPDYTEGPEGIARAVDRLAGAGFDLIIPFMESPGGCVKYHRSEATIDPSFKDWDMLAVLAEEAGKADIKVHACLNPYLAGKDSRITDEALYARTRTGELMSRFCPSAEEPRKMKRALYQEVMDGYPVAGVHMDYIRYHQPNECFCDRCRAAFKKETGVDPMDIGETWGFNESSERAANRRHPAWVRWIEWRVSNITTFVEKLSALTKAAGKELSAAVFMEYPGCIVDQGQNWTEWGERKLVDYLFPMTYTNSALMVRKRTRSHVVQVKGSCQVWEGLGKRSSRSQLTPEELLEQARSCREEGAEGVVIFAYSSLADEDLEALLRLV
jgi:uncharacterized lipoprotein YddW (UPF0748 family)